MEKVHCCPCLLRTLVKGVARPQIRMDIARRLISSQGPLYVARAELGKGPPARVKAELDQKTMDYVHENKLKYQQHPGAFHLSKVSLPEKFRHAVEQIVSHVNVKRIVANASNLSNHLWARRLPIDDEQYKSKVSQIESKIRLQEETLLPFLSQEEIEKLEQKRNSAILKNIRKTVYHWEPMAFNKEKALEYLFARSAGEYAALCRIFNEISKRDPQFKPTTLCDFGSGIGTVSWAAREYWSESLVEHLCADVSWEMHELAELILRGGSKNDDHPIPALFLRSHLPESYKIQYNMVVSAFSLMELPSTKDRLEMIDKLWNKTEDYLVLVELGTKAGFTIIQEARDYILGLGSKHKKPAKCYVFSPCPNNMECPRFSFDTDPCNFGVKFRPVYPFHQDGCGNTMFSYVVIRRGYEDPNEEKWPRLIAKPMIGRRHVICRLCTKEAELKEVVLTRKNHSMSFRLMARRSRWGDLLPFHLKDSMEETDETEKYDVGHESTEPENYIDDAGESGGETENYDDAGKSK